MRSILLLAGPHAARPSNAALHRANAQQDL
ncbi:MAG: hypothetical protein QOK37_1236 [Thermoanaerobaculia bacterium]|jgi:hypothetical protein|nr:hypothetical protein [Thermoanaerobaculia bacterium]